RTLVLRRWCRRYHRPMVATHVRWSTAPKPAARHAPAATDGDEGDNMDLETIRTRQEGAVLFADLSAPPMNLLCVGQVRDLWSLIQRAEGDAAIQTLVFTSADPDYFIAHVDVTRIGEYREVAAKLTGEASLGLLFRYLSNSRLVTIAQI